jgi:hypothetical protein
MYRRTPKLSCRAIFLVHPRIVASGTKKCHVNPVAMGGDGVGLYGDWAKEHADRARAIVGRVQRERRA